MKRDKRLPAARSRDRILNDDEIRGLWTVLEAVDPITGNTKIDQTFASIVKLCLITGQRREKVVSMRWEDLELDIDHAVGAWQIPTEEREKGNAGMLVLPTAALEILKRRPIINDSPFVFAVGRSRKRKWPVSLPGRSASVSSTRCCRSRLGPSTILRRTARSLMARIGVSKDLAERVLGHKEGGVVGIYDRHHYTDEVADAVARLAGELERILNVGAKDQRAA